MNALTLGLTIGFFGSWHCLGMCGPLALALPYRDSGLGARVVKSLLYNLGRTITYIIIGLILASIGQRMAMAGFQRGFSIVVGSVLIYFLLVPRHYKRLALKIEQTSIISIVKRQIQQQFAQKGLLTFFFAGLFNGFLPCGMVYMAGAAALGSVSVESGSMLMLGFGVGTWPMMLGVALSSQIRLLPSVQPTKWIVSMMFLFGVVMIWRGVATELPDIPQMGQFNPKSLTICGQ